MGGFLARKANGNCNLDDSILQINVHCSVAILGGVASGSPAGPTHLCMATGTFLCL